MKIERFEDIDGWKKGRELAHLVYSFTRCLDFSKDYGLKDQITRASVSIMNNIAEGFDTGSDAEFARFLSYAQRSSTEVQSCLYVAVDTAYISADQFHEAYNLAEEAKRMIGGFIRFLKTKTKHQAQRTKD